MSNITMNTRYLVVPSITLALSIVAFAGSVTGQCGPEWLPGTGVPGVLGQVDAIVTWDPDGSGPLGPVLVVAGDFERAGDILAENVALYDPVTGQWAALGQGVNRRAVALDVLPNGDLVVGGGFWMAGGQPAESVATWNGSSWAATGLNLPFSFSPIRDLVVMQNGDVVIGGDFDSVNGVSTNGIARWDGATWFAMPGFAATSVSDLLVRGSGELVVSGGNGIYLWAGSTWQQFGQTIRLLGGNSAPSDMLELPSGELLVGGRFDYVDGVLAQGTAVWNGSAWGAFAPPPPPTVSIESLGRLPNGDVVIGGGGDFDPQSATNHLARWDGTAWQPLGDGMRSDFARILDLTRMPSGELVVAGVFDQAGAAGVSSIATWDGVSWRGLAPGTNAGELRIFEQPNGQPIACGFFSAIGGYAARDVAQWDGAAWTPIGDSTFGGGIPRIVRTLDNGDVIAVGTFSSVAGVITGAIARFDGASWQPLVGGSTASSGASFADLAPLEDDQFVIGGSFTTVRGVAAARVAQWDGADWKPMGLGFSDGRVESLVRLPNGDILAAGSMAISGTTNIAYLARWDGAQWQRYAGGANDAINQLRVLANGDLLAVGSFSSIGGLAGVGGVAAPGIARWDGANWTAVSSNGLGMFVTSVAELPNGDLVFGGSNLTAGGYQANYIAVWDGSSWSGIGAGMDDDVRGLAYVPATGELLATGDFETANGETNYRVARIASDCPAGAVTFGSGCTGSGGANVLEVASLPWLGASYRYRASGLPANALALDVRGLSATGLPLNGILAEALPGCDLLVDPVVVELGLPVGGALPVEWAIPSTASLLGVQLRNQIVAFGFDAAGTLTEVTSTNALLATIGSY